MSNGFFAQLSADNAVTDAAETLAPRCVVDIGNYAYTSGAMDDENFDLEK